MMERNDSRKVLMNFSDSLISFARCISNRVSMKIFDLHIEKVATLVHATGQRTNLELFLESSN